MNIFKLAVALAFAFILARPVAAQDDVINDTAKPVPAEAPATPAAKAAETPKAEAPKAAEPEAKPEPKPEPKPAKKEQAKKEAPKELSSVAKALQPLAESYKKAYEELELWIGQVDQQTAEVGAKIAKAQDEIQKNEAAITKAKLDGDDKGARELNKANKQLWTDLAAAKRERSALAAGFGREAAQKVKGFSADTAEKLQQAKSELK